MGLTYNGFFSTENGSGMAKKKLTECPTQEEMLSDMQRLEPVEISTGDEIDVGTYPCQVGLPIDEASRRKRRRTSRAVFTSDNLRTLEGNFQAHKYLDVYQRQALVGQTGLTETCIQNWFQNRRAKYRKEHRRMSEESGVEKLRRRVSLPDSQPTRRQDMVIPFTATTSRQQEMFTTSTPSMKSQVQKAGDKGATGEGSQGVQLSLPIKKPRENAMHSFSAPNSRGAFGPVCPGVSGMNNMLDLNIHGNSNPLLHGYPLPYPNPMFGQTHVHLASAQAQLAQPPYIPIGMPFQTGLPPVGGIPQGMFIPPVPPGIYEGIGHPYHNTMLWPQQSMPFTSSSAAKYNTGTPKH